MSIRESCFADLTDVTLADEDTNSILADNAKGVIQGNDAFFHHYQGSIDFVA